MTEQEALWREAQDVSNIGAWLILAEIGCYLSWFLGWFVPVLKPSQEEWNRLRYRIEVNEAVRERRACYRDSYLKELWYQNPHGPLDSAYNW